MNLSEQDYREIADQLNRVHPNPVWAVGDIKAAEGGWTLFSNAPRVLLARKAIAAKWAQKTAAAALIQPDESAKQPVKEWSVNDSRNSNISDNSSLGDFHGKAITAPAVQSLSEQPAQKAERDEARETCDAYREEMFGKTIRDDQDWAEQHILAKDKAEQKSQADRCDKAEAERDTLKSQLAAKEEENKQLTQSRSLAYANLGHADEKIAELQQFIADNLSK